MASEFALVAEGNCVPNDVLAFIAAALDLQMRQDVAPRWNADPWSVVALNSLDGVTSTTLKVLTFKKSLDVDGALGFHTDVNGVEYAECLVPLLGGPTDPIDGTTASHEVIETFGDPTCDVTVDSGDGRRVDHELCDACEADYYPITVTLGTETRTVNVSNFVLDGWFTGVGDFDFMKKITTRFGMSPGGYFQYTDRQGNVQQVFADAEAHMAWMTKLANPASRVHRRLRKMMAKYREHARRRF